MSALDAELWIWYALTLVIVSARLASRRMFHGSFRKLQVDDWLMFVVILADTALTIGVKVLTYTPTNLIEPGTETDFTTEQYRLREIGSKVVLVVEQMQILLIWTIKICLLIMYSRLTSILKHNYMIKITAGYVVISWVVMEVLWFGVWCRPFWHYWQIPPDSIQCSIEKNHLIMNAVFNISSDLMIISIPMPVFLQARLPIKRKAILCAVFALGFFTILSAILNKYYSFSQPYGTEWTYWYIREASTAVIVANLPFTWTLLQRVFNVRSFHGKSTGNTPVPASRLRSSYGNFSRRMSRFKDDKLVTSTRGERSLGSSESQEQINLFGEVPLVIYKHNEVQITEEYMEGRPSPTQPEKAKLALRGYNRHCPHEPSESDLGLATTVGRGL